MVCFKNLLGYCNMQADLENTLPGSRDTAANKQEKHLRGFIGICVPLIQMEEMVDKWGKRKMKLERPGCT